MTEMQIIIKIFDIYIKLLIFVFKDISIPTKLLIALIKKK